MTDRFFDEITTLLEFVATFQSQVVISGDFKIHVDDPNDRHGHHLLVILDSLDMVQNITGSTHNGGHTLDLVITRRNFPPTGYGVGPPVYSDHGLVICAFPPVKWLMTLHYITLHYITLRHCIRQLHLQWPMVHQQSHSSFPNASLKRWVFKSFLKVSVFVSSWRLDRREFYAFGPENEKLHSPNFSFNRGSSYRKLLEDLSLSRPGRSATDDIISDRYAGPRPTRTMTIELHRFIAFTGIGFRNRHLILIIVWSIAIGINKQEQESKLTPLSSYGGENISTVLVCIALSND